MAQWMQCNFIQTTPTWADAACNISPSGGYVSDFPAPRRRTPEDTRRERAELGIITREAQAVIDATAARQAEALLAQDAQQRFEELERELTLAGIEWESRYLEATNTLRERLIDQEIGRRLRIKLQNEQALLAMLLLL